MIITRASVGLLIGVICSATHGQGQPASDTQPPAPPLAESSAELAPIVKPTDSPPASPSPTAPRTSALLRSAQNLIDRYSPEARKKLNEIDAKSTLAYAQGLKNSLQSSNWPEAQKFADQLGEKLNSGAIGACVRFLGIHAREGANAASQAIETYLATADIPPEQRKFFEDLRTSIATMDAEDVIDTVTVITMIVCSHKFGHEGVLIAAIMSEGVKEIFQVERKPRDASGKPLKDPARQESAAP